MARFAVNTHRIDPYRISKFQVVLDGRVVPDIVRVGALRRETETVLYRAGDFPNHLVKAPGLTDFDPIVMERGITHDTTFEEWAELCYSAQGDAAISLKSFRKDMLINLLNRQGTVVLSYRVYRAWVSEYTALPELDAHANEVAVETITIQHEGWERDKSVSEPAET